MEILLVGFNGAFVLIMTLVLTWYVRDRFGEVKQGLREVRGEMRELRSETRDDIAGLRSDLMHIVLNLGNQPRPDSA